MDGLLRNGCDSLNPSFFAYLFLLMQLSHGRNRTQLLERRQSRMNVPVEHPYQATSSSPYLQQAHAVRERDFAQKTGLHLDEMLHQGKAALDNLYQQRSMLKVSKFALCFVSSNVVWEDTFVNRHLTITWLSSQRSARCWMLPIPWGCRGMSFS